MKVQDIFTLYGEDSSRFKLLSGEKGLSKPVKSVEILEVPDGVFWCIPDEVVITTGYSLKKDDITLDTFVQVMIDKGVSALGIKIGRYIESIPERILEYANANNFTIFSVPITFSYDQIIGPIKAKILNDNDYNFLSIKALREEIDKLPKDEITIERLIKLTSKYISKSTYILWADTLSEIENSIEIGNRKVKDNIKKELLSIHKSDGAYDLHVDDKIYSVYKIENISNTLAFLCIETSKEDFSNTEYK